MSKEDTPNIEDFDEPDNVFDEIEEDHSFEIEDDFDEINDLSTTSDTDLGGEKQPSALKEKLTSAGKNLIIGGISAILGVLLILFSGLFASDAEIPQINVNKVDANYNNQLVYASGKLSSTEFTDPLFSITATGAELKRVVEMYQWVEESGELEKGWEEEIIVAPSDANWGAEIKNPSEMPFLSDKWAVDEIKLGSFKLSPSIESKAILVKEIELTKDDFNKLNSHGQSAFLLHNGKYYHGIDPQNPRIGDLRVSFIKKEANIVTILAKQQGRTLIAFDNGDSVIEKVMQGNVPLQGITNNIDIGGSTLFVWIARLISLLMIAFGVMFSMGKIGGKKDSDKYSTGTSDDGFNEISSNEEMDIDFSHLEDETETKEESSISEQTGSQAEQSIDVSYDSSDVTENNEDDIEEEIIEEEPPVNEEPEEEALEEETFEEDAEQQVEEEPTEEIIEESASNDDEIEDENNIEDMSDDEINELLDSIDMVSPEEETFEEAEKEEELLADEEPEEEATDQTSEHANNDDEEHLRILPDTIEFVSGDDAIESEEENAPETSDEETISEDDNDEQDNIDEQIIPEDDSDDDETIDDILSSIDIATPETVVEEAPQKEEADTKTYLELNLDSEESKENENEDSEEETFEADDSNSIDFSLDEEPEEEIEETSDAEGDIEEEEVQEKPAKKVIMPPIPPSFGSASLEEIDEPIVEESTSAEDESSNEEPAIEEEETQDIDFDFGFDNIPEDFDPNAEMETFSDDAELDEFSEYHAEDDKLSFEIVEDNGISSDEEDKK